MVRITGTLGNSPGGQDRREMGEDDFNSE